MKVIDDHDVTVWQGDAREQLALLPAESVQCIVTSPPYFGLRDYGMPGQIGLEPSPAAYVETLRTVFNEARRVLAKDGVMWLNLGASYASGTGGAQGKTGQRANRAFTASGLGASGAPRDAQTHGTPYTERSGSPGPDSSCSDLCDECATALSSRSADISPPLPDVVPLPAPTGRGIAHRDSAAASLAAALRDAPVSTSPQSSGQPPGPCSHCGNCGVCLSVLRSSGRDARLCGRRAAYISGSVGTASDGRNQGTDALGTAWLKYSEMLGPKNLIPTPWMVAMTLQTDGWILRNAVIWGKKNAMPESVTDRLSTRHEHVFLFSKSRRYWFGLDAIREPLVYPDAADGTRVFGGSNKAAELTTGSSARRTGNVYVAATTGRNPGDVWSIATAPTPYAHFATMPPELVRRCILAGCAEGATVLDPFAGSGTTLMVARKLARRSVGIELNPGYVDIIRRRIGQEPLLFGEETA